ncbi:unnamed protein product [Paramecium sonneborni]|uniref:Ribosomal protein S15 n=1 Tax=Paramecium sonneborni TaxID=65129 RepID=A0A8S1KLR5_9CILI|nr:unnamed protein product [Paramecium sonneborni]
MFTKQFLQLRSVAFISRTRGGLASEIYVRKSHKFLHSIYKKESPIENAQQIVKDFKLTLGQRYQHGFELEEMKEASPLVQKAFSLNNATDSQIVAYRIQQAIKKYQKWPLDTASSLVKAAVLNERVISLMNHMEKNRQDKYCALTLTKLLSARRKAMYYLRIHDYQGFLWLVADYGLKDLKYHNHNYLRHKHIAATKKKRYTRKDTNKTRWAL